MGPASEVALLYVKKRREAEGGQSKSRNIMVGGWRSYLGAVDVCMGGGQRLNGLSAIDPLSWTLGPPAMHPGKWQVKMCDLRQHFSSKLI